MPRRLTDYGDDDRNMRFDQTTDLVQLLKVKGVAFEEPAIPDEIHDFLMYRPRPAVYEATLGFFDRQFMKP